MLLFYCLPTTTTMTATDGYYHLGSSDKFVVCQDDYVTGK